MSSPSNSAGASTDASLIVADRLHAVRTEKGLTLDGLARLCGLSPAYLSRVENHKAAITIEGLNKVAQALGVQLKSFFEAEDSISSSQVCPRGKGRFIRIPGRRITSIEMLAADKRGKLMEPLLVTLAGRAGGRKIAHAGEEFNYVISGACEMTYGTQNIRLSSGDSIYYDATVPHRLQRVGSAECRILSICSSRDYLFHGDIARLLFSK